MNYPIILAKMEEQEHYLIRGVMLFSFGIIFPIVWGYSFWNIMIALILTHLGLWGTVYQYRKIDKKYENIKKASVNEVDTK